MKKVIFSIFAVLSLMLTACNKTEPACLSVVESNVDFTYEAGEGSVDFQTSSDIVSAEVDQEWCRTTIRRTTVVVRTDENTGTEARTAQLTVKNKEGLSQTVEISQKGVRYAFEPADLEFTADGGENSVEFFGPKMVVVIPDGAKEWLSAEVGESSVKFICEPNDAITTRTAKVGFAISSKSGSFNVSQAANEPYITFDPEMTEVSTSSDPADIVYTYKTNSPTTPVATTAYGIDWLKVIVTPDEEVAGTGTFKVHFDLNNSLKARESSFSWSILKDASVKGTVAVKQAAAEKIITHFDLVDDDRVPVTEFSSSFKGGEFSATIKTNASGWSAAADVDWITGITPATFENPEFEEVTKAFKFTVSPSTLGQERTGKVTITVPEMNPVVVTVTQDKYVGVKLTVTSITYDGAITHMVPSDPNFIYLVDTMEKEAFEEYKSEEEVYESEIDYLEYLASMYDYTLEEVIGMVSYQGEDDDDMTGYLDPETEYVVYAIPVSADGKLIGAVTSASYKTKVFPYKYIGEGTFTDDILLSGFGKTVTPYKVDVYESTTTSGKFYMDTPYGPQFLSVFTGQPVEECEKYTGNYKSVMVEIDATDPTKVVWPFQELGSNLNSTYGWMSAGNKRNSTVYGYGKYENGVISFPTANSFRMMMEKMPTSLYYANSNGKTSLVMPTTNSAQPSKALKSRSGKTAVSKHNFAKKPVKSFSPKEFHVMAIPFEK